MERTRVLIVDDSALFREMLTASLGRAADVEVVGTAPDPLVAWTQIKALRPHVLTLDLEMPKMDGLTFLANLMAHHPMPVVVVSSLTQRGCATTMRALEMGALEVVEKPKLDLRTGTVALEQELLNKVRAAAHCRVSALVSKKPRPRVEKVAAARGPLLSRTTEKIIAVGASTGGTEALASFFSALPADAPGILVVQHMPARFTSTFAERLNRLSRVRVKEAVHGDRVLPGHALVAPGNYHMSLRRSGAQYIVDVTDGPAVSGHRPSVDVLFHSCAKYAGANAVGVLMTGMGADGAEGLLAMRKANGHTFAQDEATCVVFGMPKEALKCHAVDRCLPLHDLAPAAIEAVLGA